MMMMMMMMMHGLENVKQFIQLSSVGPRGHRNCNVKHGTTGTHKCANNRSGTPQVDNRSPAIITSDLVTAFCRTDVTQFERPLNKFQHSARLSAPTRRTALLSKPMTINIKGTQLALCLEAGQNSIVFFIVAPCMLLRLFLFFQLMHTLKTPIHINT